MESSITTKFIILFEKNIYFLVLVERNGHVSQFISIAF